MVERCRGDFSFHYSDAWDAANVGTQKVTAEDVTMKDKQRHNQLNFDLRLLTGWVRRTIND